MFEKILLRIREIIRRGEYIATLHAEEEMDADEFTIFDVESAILTGKIIECQKVQAVNEWKYRIRGLSTDDRKIELVAKISITGKLVIITVYKI